MDTTELRHSPTDECDGSGVSLMTFERNGFGVMIREPYRCAECSAHLCGCELWYGHDCEG